ncbi:Pol polyprotein, partial [Caligus rogercresseyi]
MISPSSVEVPQITIIREIENKTRSLWLKEWHGEQSCRQTKFFFPDLKQRWKLHTHTRISIHNIVSFVSGHIRMKKHLKEMGLADEDSCRLCGEERESPIHFVNSCDALAGVRRNLTEDREDYRWSKDDVSHFIRALINTRQFVDVFFDDQILQ